MGRQTDIWLDNQMAGWTDGETQKQTDRTKDGEIDRWMDRDRNRQADGWIYRWMYVGQMKRHTKEGRKDTLHYSHVTSIKAQY